MAEQTNTSGAAEARKPGKKQLVIAAIALLAVVSFVYSHFFESAPPPKTSDGEQKNEAQSASGNIGSTADLAGPDLEGYRAGFEKRLVQQSEEIQKLQQQLAQSQEATNTQIGKLHDEMTTQFGKIVETQVADKNAYEERIRSGGDNGSLPPLGGLPSGTPQQTSTAPGPRGMLAFVPAPSVSGGGSKTAGTDLLANVPGIGQNASVQVPGQIDKALVKPTIKVQIAAASFAHITTLHGVDCPVNDSGPSGAVGGQAVPVVLPIEGSFRGPNGSTQDIGSAHLLGKCVGLQNTVKGDKARARIVVDLLSYVDRDGNEQKVPVQGYVVDRRDSSEDVLGRYDSKQGAALAKSAMASAAAAVASLGVANQYTNTTNPSSGSVTSAFTGSLANAALPAVISGIAQRTADFYQKQADSQVPYVHVDAALPLEFVSTAPFTVDTGEDLTSASLY